MAWRMYEFDHEGYEFRTGQTYQGLHFYIARRSEDRLWAQWWEGYVTCTGIEISEYMGVVRKTTRHNFEKAERWWGPAEYWAPNMPPEIWKVNTSFGVEMLTKPPMDIVSVLIPRLRDRLLGEVRLAPRERRRK